MSIESYHVTFELQGVPLEARRLSHSKDKNTGWNVEDFAVHHAGESGSSIDQIQLYSVPSSGEWSHWPTKFSSDHKKVGAALAEARTQNPETHEYSVLVDLHKLADLSDKPTAKRIPSLGTSPSDAVYRLRALVEKDNVLVLQSGNRRYVGRVHLSRVSG